MPDKDTSRASFKDLSYHDKADFILEKRTPSPELVIFEPTIGFLDPQGMLSREERGRVIAMGDRTTISYERLAEQVVADREAKPIDLEGETLDSTSAFYLMYTLAARSSRQIAHTSILEQVNPGPSEEGGDPPIILEGITTLAALRDMCGERHFGFEAFSSRGGIFPDGYWRIPEELTTTSIGPELEIINREIYDIYIELTRSGLEYYLERTNQQEGEKLWQYQWRVLNYALDDSRQVTNGSFLNHMSMHANSALSLREALVRFSSSELPETRVIAEGLRDLASRGLPTLMRFTEASPYVESLPGRRRRIIGELDIPQSDIRRGQVAESRFLDATVTPDASRLFLASFLAREGKSSFPHLSEALKSVPGSQIREYIDEIFDGIGVHDKPPEELEMIQVVASYEMSVGAIYELIRHRLSTHLFGNFTADLGFTIPDAFMDQGIDQAYLEAIRLNERQFDMVASMGEEFENVFAPYFVSRAHLQPVTVRASGADIFHFIKLRAQANAHPDISLPALGLEQFLKDTEGVVFGHVVKK